MTPAAPTPPPAPAIHLEYGAAPSTAGAFGRALLGTRRPRRAPQPPPLTALQRDVAVQAARLARYRALCGFPPGTTAPATFAQVLAFPLHLALYTHPAFPLRLLGAVHLRNAISQRRALAAGERIAIRVALTGWRDTPRGIEHDLTTEVDDASGARVWTGVSTVLSPDLTADRKPSGPRPQPPPFARAERLDAPPDTGRRYARVSGDWNPIHLHPLTARPFGFRRPIAHGMWTLARALAVLAPPDAADVDVDVAFRRPLFLPGAAVLHWTPDAAETRFEVRSAAGDATHLQGAVRTR